MGTLRDRNERINRWLWRQSISLQRDPVGGTWSGGSLTGDFEGKVKICFYQGTCKPGGWKCVYQEF